MVDLHLFQGIIDYSIDEAVAGNCNEIIVTLSDNQKKYLKKSI